MNAAVRAVTRGALARGWEVVRRAQRLRRPAGGHDGRRCRRATSAASSSRAARCSAAPAAPEFAEAAGAPRRSRNLRGEKVDALVVIGGNGSQSGSASLAREGFPVVGVPSTIDNDLYGNDVSIGCDTGDQHHAGSDRPPAHHRLIAPARLRGRDHGPQLRLHRPHGGHRRRCGGRSRSPESELKPDEVAERLRAAYKRGKTHALVVIAEGAEVRRARADGVLRRTSQVDRLRPARHAPRPRRARRHSERCGPRPRHAARCGGDRHALRAASMASWSASSRATWLTTPLVEIAGKMRPADASLLELAEQWRS